MKFILQPKDKTKVNALKAQLRENFNIVVLDDKSDSMILIESRLDKTSLRQILPNWDIHEHIVHEPQPTARPKTRRF